MAVPPSAPSAPPPMGWGHVPRAPIYGTRLLEAYLKFWRVILTVSADLYFLCVRVLYKHMYIILHVCIQTCKACTHNRICT